MLLFQAQRFFFTLFFNHKTCTKSPQHSSVQWHRELRYLFQTGILQRPGNQLYEAKGPAFIWDQCDNFHLKICTTLVISSFQKDLDNQSCHDLSSRSFQHPPCTMPWNLSTEKCCREQNQKSLTLIWDRYSLQTRHLFARCRYDPGTYKTPVFF